jgi:tetratricopeptide (TPR) repeat protein
MLKRPKSILPRKFSSIWLFKQIPPPDIYHNTIAILISLLLFPNIAYSKVENTSQTIVQQTIKNSQEATRAAAQKASDEGLALFKQQTAQSLQQAIVKLKEALVLWRQVGDKSGEAGTLNNIGLVYSDLGDKKQALQFYNPSLPLSRKVGDKSGEATTLSNIGLLYRDTKQPKQAITYLQQSVEITLQLRRILDRQFRKTFLESNSGSAIALIDLLINQNQAEKAYEWLNLTTTADLADYSRLINAKVSNPETQKILEAWNQKNLQLEAKRQELQKKIHTSTFPRS